MSNYENLKNSHPCFGGHKTNKGRIHLPVSPGCNIECKFCDRKINQTEQRPGVSSGVLKESEALEVIRRSLELCPEITVAGIAGPGDTLASPYALNTFKLIKEEFPIKVNTVLIPGINEDHIEEVARIVSEAGATIYNIIPLIPQHELKEVKAPGCLEIDRARLKAGNYIDVFRHCQRCRADAVGIPGEKEFADQIYFGRLSMKETFSHG
ncbi:MAG: Radical domain protein [Anaerocolumna sp.]|jgi:MoaA/NifB/PqqE/SkfB family radical SAM enzyme|nr:Radical domain protein [Anaerocolumna sp.]